MDETIDKDTHCPACGIDNEKYKTGESKTRYCGCADPHE